MKYTHLSHFLFTDEEFSSCSKYHRLKIRCRDCGKIFFVHKPDLQRRFDKLDPNNKFFDYYLKQLECCPDCRNHYSPKNIIVDCVCGYCGKHFKRPLNRVLETKTGLHFCHQKCARQYYADHNISRSKVNVDWVDDNVNGNFLFTSADAYKVNTPQTYYKKLLPVKCLACGKIFNVSFGDLTLSQQHTGKSARSPLACCCKKCSDAYQRVNEIRMVPCAYCGKLIPRIVNKYTNELAPSSHQYSRSKKAFCSSKCMNAWYSEHDEIDRSHGNRSKMEVYTEHLIRALFPQLKIRVCDRSVVAPYELDIYCPDLKLGIEINGGQHYSACLGSTQQSKQRTFEITLQRDKNKVVLAQQKQIEIVYINGSRLKGFYFFLAKCLVKPLIVLLVQKLNIQPDWNAFDIKELEVEKQLLTTDQFSKVGSDHMKTSTDLKFDDVEKYNNCLLENMQDVLDR